MATKMQYGKKKSNLPIGLIVGGVVAGVVVVAMIVVFAIYSAARNSASQDTAKNMAAASSQPAPGRSGQGIVPKNRQQAGTQVSSLTEAKTAVENGPKLSQAVAWMTFSP